MFHNYNWSKMYVLQQYAPVIIIYPFPSTTDSNALRLMRKCFATAISYIGILNGF